MKTGKYMLFHVSISLVGLFIVEASWLHFSRLQWTSDQLGKGYAPVVRQTTERGNE